MAQILDAMWQQTQSKHSSLRQPDVEDIICDPRSLHLASLHTKGHIIPGHLQGKTYEDCCKNVIDTVGVPEAVLSKRESK